jgi:hypothetical protein
MAGIYQFEFVLWCVSLLFQVTVFTYLLFSRKSRAYPGLTAYLGMNIFQSVFLYAIYIKWGFGTAPTKRPAWISQIPVLSMRAWAVADICRLLLNPYAGIWRLAWRILALLASGLVLGSILTAGRDWNAVVFNLNISLEWTTVLLIVAMFLFARYYEIEASPVLRNLALGFLLYSSFAVVNATILNHWLSRYSNAWNILGTLSFLASVCLWLSAVLKPVPVQPKVSLLPSDLYQTLTPQLNLRLRTLNERLSRLWNPEGHRP